MKDWSSHTHKVLSKVRCVCVCMYVWDRHRCPLQPQTAHSHALSIPPWVIPSHTPRKHTGNYLLSSLVSHAQASQNLLRRLCRPTVLFAALSICVCLQNRIHKLSLVCKHIRERERGVTRPNPMSNMSMPYAKDRCCCCYRFSYDLTIDF